MREKLNISHVCRFSPSTTADAHQQQFSKDKVSFFTAPPYHLSHYNFRQVCRRIDDWLADGSHGRLRTCLGTVGKFEILSRLKLLSRNHVFFYLFQCSSTEFRYQFCILFVKKVSLSKNVTVPFLRRPPDSVPG